MIVGVDFDTYKATMVGLPLLGGGGPIVETVVFRREAGDDAAYEALRHVTRLLLHHPGRETLIDRGEVFFIERGWGASRRADWWMGAFFGVIWDTCSYLAEANVMNAQEWKKKISAACGVTTKDGSPGRGDLKKEEAHLYVREVAAAAGHDLDAFGPDALDAYAIATTGRWLNFAAAAKIGGVDERDGPTSVSDATLGRSAGGVAVLGSEKGGR